MKKLKIGFAAGFMDGFSRDGLKTFAQYRAALEELGKSMGFEILYFEKEMMAIEEAVRIRHKCDDEDVDFLLLFHPAYIIGDLVYEVMKVRCPTGLWAVEEPRDEGPMPLASFVNLCQSTGIAHQMFKGNPKKCKWFFGPLEGPLFKPRFEITVRVLLAIKNLKEARVAQIGKLADGHINHAVDNRDIYRNLSVNVTRDYEIEDIIRLSEEVNGNLVSKEMEKLERVTTRSRVKEEKVTDAVKMFLAVKEICNKNGYDAVAFSCWPKLMPLKGMCGCLVEAMLNNIGITAGCEADVMGTISMLILHLLSGGKSTVLMDLPKFDMDDNTLMLWHCGTSPFDMANERGVLLEKHYFADYTEDPGLTECGPVTDVLFRNSPVTVFRITGEADHFYYFTGRTFESDKKTFSGSRGWTADLKLYDEPVAVLDLINTILMRVYAHHYPMVMENLSPYLEEFAYWMDLKKVKKTEYRDYLSVE